MGARDDRLIFFLNRNNCRMEVPTATSLRDIYPDDAIPEQQKRWERLFARFKEEFGKQAEFVSRSPGRVNLIGEVGVSSLTSSTLANKHFSISTTRYTRFYQWLSRSTLS